MLYRRIIYLTAGAIFFLLSLPACQTASAADAKRVMILHSFGRDFRPWTEYAKAIRLELDRQSPWPLQIIDQSLMTALWPDEESEIPFIEYLRVVFAKRPLDLIVAIGAPAAGFVQRRRQQLFPSTPMVFTAVEQRRIQQSHLTEFDTVVAVAHDLPAIIDNILQVLPETKTIAVVNGNSANEIFWLEELRREFSPFANRVAFIWYNEQSFEDILKHAAELPPHSAIFWHLMSVDAAGVAHEGEIALRKLYAVASAPVFSYDGSFFGGETVGGPMHSVSELAQLAAAAAVRILGGEKAGDIKVPATGFARPIFDWRLMQRWGISESRLSPGSIIEFREPTAWERYRMQILAVNAAFVLLTLLLVWSLREHWRRRIAETQLLQRLDELAQVNRFATAGELTASIAHEIRQPLAAIAAFGSAGLNWIRKTPPDLGEARVAIEKVVEESHRAGDFIKGVRSMFSQEEHVRELLDLNELIEHALAIMAGAIKANDIAIEVNFSNGGPLIVAGDPIQLQQVILNLAMNAVEAMRGSEKGTRVLRIETKVRAATSVVVRFIDTGPSIDPKVADNMFQPFFTTKSGGMGMGLSICKSIIEAHGGSLTAVPNRPRGMEFQIVLLLHSTHGKGAAKSSTKAAPRQPLDA